MPTRVVSVPCFELFEQQPKAYQDAVIGRSTVRVAVEAGVRQGWERFIGEDGGFVGMSASAPRPRPTPLRRIRHHRRGGGGQVTARL